MEIPILSILIFLPLAAALLLAFVPNAGVVRAAALAVSLAEIVLAALFLNFEPDAALHLVEKADWLPSLGMSYYLAADGISILMIWLSIFTLPLCVLCSWSSVAERVKEFHLCLLLMTGACVGVFCAMDLVLFYVFWEAMLIPMYLLIAVWGGARRRYASIKFFIYTLAGSVLLLVVFAALRMAGGTFSIPELMRLETGFSFQIWIFLGLALAFAVKIPMFPLHTWLPAAHVEAPAAGSVMLAAVLLKMGAYGFLRFCLPLAPEASAYFAPLMIVLSAIAIIYGGLVALGQSDVKRLVAYSSVAHMGFITMGIFLFRERGIQGAIIQMLNHGVVTGALFMLIGFLYERTHSREIGDNLGLGKWIPAFMMFWGVFALASFGFPGTNGFVGEMLIFLAAFARQPVVFGLMIIGALLGAAYMFRVSLKMAWGSPSKGKGLADLNPREWICLIVPVALVFWIGLAPGFFLKTTQASAKKLASDIKLMKDAPAMFRIPGQWEFEPARAGADAASDAAPDTGPENAGKGERP